MEPASVGAGFRASSRDRSVSTANEVFASLGRAMGCNASAPPGTDIVAVSLDAATRASSGAESRREHAEIDATTTATANART
jgi:hypothetical protein